MSYRVVFDTNVLISALLSTTSKPFRCLALAKTGMIESVSCSEVLNEFYEKLMLKFKFSEEMAKAAATEIRQLSQLVRISGKLRAIPQDPNDDMVIECGVVGSATHIVTGDKQLLSLGHYESIEIVKPAEFLRLLSPY